MIETEPVHMLGILLKAGVCAQLEVEIREIKRKQDITSTISLIHI